MQTKTIKSDDDGIRLDRWFKRYYPSVTHAQLQKLLREKNVRVGGRKASADQRLEAGQAIKLPDFQETDRRIEARELKRKPLTEKDIEFVQSLVMYKNADLIAINKPQGLAVQGGTGVAYHLEMLLDGLRFDAAERPKLVHRLDKETSGVMVLARHSQAASYLAGIFKTRDTKKIYWALVKGVPKVKQGKISLPLMKKEGKNGFERMVVDMDEGLGATTFYRTVEEAGREFSFLEVMPRSGRTHQIRVHMAEMGHPIVGDDKYWPREVEKNRTLPDQLHLHAKALIFKGLDGKAVSLEAPLPEHIIKSFDILGFTYKNIGNSFKSFDEVLK